MMSPMPSRITSPWVSLNCPLSRNANWMRRPRSKTPVRPVTPSREPVLPRKLPSSGVPTKSPTRVPLRPATGRPSYSVANSERWARVSAATRVAQVTRLPRSRPEPSFSAPSATGTPSSLSLAVIAAIPAAGRALLRRLHAELLGEHLRREVVARREHRVHARRAAQATRPRRSRSRSPARHPCSGEPTCTPRARSSSVSSAAALRVGSSTGTLRDGDQLLNPSLTVSALSGPTSPSVR